MAQATRQITIAGAGIAGLSAALSFARAGHTVAIFERAPHLEEVGAGLQLSPNATRILQRLGVLERLLPLAVKPEEIAVRRADTLRLLTTVPLGQFAENRWGAPYLTIHRADLQQALLQAVHSEPLITLELGASVDACDTRRDFTAATINRNGARATITADLVIGADGVWSTLRGAIDKAISSNYTGYLAWRAILTDAPTLFPRDRVTTFVHANFHLVAYPIQGGDAVNLVAVTRAPEPAKGWAGQASGASLDASLRSAAPALRDAIRAAGPWTTWPIHEVDPAGRWSDGKGIALIGDAAHALSPYAAQGAAMAIEDGAILAKLVTNASNLPAALSSYENQRRERLKKVASRGAFNRFAWHAAGPIALGRDFVLSLRKPEQLAGDMDWLYGFDTDQ
jgi:salicylate hydroxylase